MPRHIIINLGKAMKRIKAENKTFKFEGIMNNTRLIIRSYPRQKTVERYH